MSVMAVRNVAIDIVVVVVRCAVKVLRRIVNVKDVITAVNLRVMYVKDVRFAVPEANMRDVVALRNGDVSIVISKRTSKFHNSIVKIPTQILRWESKSSAGTISREGSLTCKYSVLKWTSRLWFSRHWLLSQSPTTQHYPKVLRRCLSVLFSASLCSTS